MKIITNFTENGIAKSGLSPEISITNITDIGSPSEVTSGEVMTEVGYGYYAYEFDGYTEQNEYIVSIDGTSTMTDFERYKFGSIDKIEMVDIPARVWDEIIEGTYDAKELMQLMGAVLASKSSGGGTATIVFRNLTDDTDRITATVDENGNRLNVTIT